MPKNYVSPGSLLECLHRRVKSRAAFFFLPGALLLASLFGAWAQETPPATNAIVLGPYLQMGTPTSVLVCWRTVNPDDSLVRLGPAPGVFSSLVVSNSSNIEHRVRLTGLQSNTRYYYGIGSTTYALAEGTNYFFDTPPVGAKPTRIWVIGDTRSGDNNEKRVRDAYYRFAGARSTDLFLNLGDNAGIDGTDISFQTNYFRMYSNVLCQTLTYPCIGNHDSYTSNAFPQLNIFCLPTAGEAGGVASGSERYYSFDYGNIHFLVLDSITSDISTNGPMYAWAKRDLQANTNDWLIVYWHSAPYSKGNHDSDTEAGMITMRQNFVSLCEAYGADLMLFGHSHVYERSYFLDAHYGPSTSLLPSMLLNSGDGNVDGNGPYWKPALGPHPHQGAVYNVVGSSGLLSCGPLDHPAMYRSECQLGSLVIDVNSNRLDAKFLRDTGAIDDAYTIVKGTRLELTSVRLQDGHAALRWITVPGESYLVSRKTNLTDEWTAVSPNLNATNTILTWTDPGQTTTNAFYRVQQVSK